MMELRLRDRVFVIERATITGYLGDPYWQAKWGGGGSPVPALSLELEAEEREYDGAFWRPKLYNEELRGVPRNWRELEGRRQAWTSEDDDAAGPPGAMYIWEHLGLHANELVFGARDGLSFDLSWRGLCDIFWNESFGKTVPFEASAMATFDRITLNGCARDDARSFLERFSQQFDPDDFVQGQVVMHRTKYEDGMGIAHCTFMPR